MRMSTIWRDTGLIILLGQEITADFTYWVLKLQVFVKQADINRQIKHTLLEKFVACGWLFFRKKKAAHFKSNLIRYDNVVNVSACVYIYLYISIYII